MNRKQFIKTTALAAVGLAIIPITVIKEENTLHRAWEHEVVRSTNYGKHWPT